MSWFIVFLVFLFKMYLYNLYFFKYIGWYDEFSVDGIEGLFFKMMKVDLDFGKSKIVYVVKNI